MQTVLLIGLQGAGKSTMYQQRFSNTHLRLNLDMLKTRHRQGGIASKPLDRGTALSILKAVETMRTLRADFTAFGVPKAVPQLPSRRPRRVPGRLMRMPCHGCDVLISSVFDVQSSRVLHGKAEYRISVAHLSHRPNARIIKTTEAVAGSFGTPIDPVELQLHYVSASGQGGIASKPLDRGTALSILKAVETMRSLRADFTAFGVPKAVPQLPSRRPRRVPGRSMRLPCHGCDVLISSVLDVQSSQVLCGKRSTAFPWHISRIGRMPGSSK